MRVNGTCHCGEIEYRAEVDPDQVSLCHCTDCQMLTGSAYRVSVPAPRATFALLKGKPTEYVKTAESGTRRVHTFCPRCGTPVYSAALADPPTVSLRVGCLEQRSQLPPRRQLWHRSAVPWSATLADVPARDKQ
jgi:hypothetical protein